MIRLAIVSLHPNNYHDGIWVRLSKRKNLCPTLLYLSQEGLDNFHDPVFKAERNWSAFINLDQYPNKFIRDFGINYSITPLTRINPGVFTEILRGEYDAVLVHGYATISAWLAILAARLRSLPLIFRGEGILPNNESSGWKHRLKELILPISFRLFASFLYDCTENRRLFEHYGVPAAKLVFMPCTANNEFFQSERQQWTGSRARSELNFAADIFLAVFVGSLTARKRPLDVVKAIHLAQERGRHDLGAILVGDGLERDRIEQFIEDQKVQNVRIVGYQDHFQIGKYYSIADVGLMVSQYDPSPRAVNEMMNFALPIICSEGVGTAHDLVQDNVNGYVIKVGDIESIADSLCKLADDREQSRQMGLKSLETVLDWNFDRNAEAVEAAVEYAMS